MHIKEHEQFQVISSINKGDFMEIPNTRLGQWTVKEWARTIRDTLPGFSARKRGRELVVERHD
jgi:hypothetical protein